MERRWFGQHIEETTPTKVDKATKLRLFELLVRSETFDNFMAKRFPQVKRYGLEGAESMMVALDTIFSASSVGNFSLPLFFHFFFCFLFSKPLLTSVVSFLKPGGVEEIVVGMPHRGRLNLLTDLLKFSPTRLFHKIKGNKEFPPEIQADGDVISHLSEHSPCSFSSSSPNFSCPVSFVPGVFSPSSASSVDLPYNDRNVHVTVLHNPSHLEAVNPVAVGKARGKQMYLYQEKSKGNELGDCHIGDRVLCIQMHGDAAFTGQGIVMETLGLSALPHFASGGSVHLIVNNQIGFTTPAVNASSGIYTSDVGKMINAPVIHVNGDHPESVVIACKIAAAYRLKFRKDIIIDLITYRRWGHNELDEPAFTQPQMYKSIRSRKSVPILFSEKVQIPSLPYFFFFTFYFFS